MRRIRTRLASRKRGGTDIGPIRMAASFTMSSTPLPHPYRARHAPPRHRSGDALQRGGQWSVADETRKASCFRQLRPLAIFFLDRPLMADEVERLTYFGSSWNISACRAAQSAAWVRLTAPIFLSSVRI